MRPTRAILGPTSTRQEQSCKEVGGGGYERIVIQRSDVTDVRKLLIKSVGQKLGDKIRSVGGQNLYARLAAQKDFTLTIGDAYVAFNLIM